MGLWQLNADTLAGSRFVVSPLAEATACLQLLDRGIAAHRGERAWLNAHLPAYRAKLAADPITARLIRAGLGGHWNADFLTPTPSGTGEQPFEVELAQVRATAPEAARADLTVSLDGVHPSELDCDDLPERAADMLEWVWTRTVLPTWPQRRRILEADMVARTVQLSQGGWAAALDDLRPGMRWLGESRLQINLHPYPPREISGAQLLFVPVTPKCGWVSWEEPHRYAVVYPCVGALAGGDEAVVPEALARLLGPGRAAVLALLGNPKSTTQLVALTGQGLGSVGRHLKVLLGARLVHRRRAGRSVLYYRTDAGNTLVQAQNGDHQERFPVIPAASVVLRPPRVPASADERGKA